MSEIPYIAELSWNNHPEFMDSFKGSIGKWAVQFSDKYSDFENEIKIESVVQIPTHVARFDTLYERRKKYFATARLDKYTKPKGERTVFDLSEIDPWDYEMQPVPDDYEPHNSGVRISGSSYIEKCKNCKGTGKLTCDSCHGKKEIICEKCTGKGESDCGTCGGRGELRCGTCNGQGYRDYFDANNHNVRKTCSACGGSKYRTCHTCNGNRKIKCSICSGKGVIPCKTCHELGYVSCGSCNGKGEKVKYIAIDQKYIPRGKVWYYHYNNLQEYYPDFDFDHEKTTGSVLSFLEEEKIPDDFYNINLDEMELEKKEFRAGLKNHLEALNAQYPEEEAGSSTVLRRQRFQLIQYDIFEIEYMFEGKKYLALVWGANREFVHSKTSPFQEQRFEFTEQANQYLNGKQYGKAVEYLKKAMEMNEDKAVQKEMEEIIRSIKGFFYKTYLRGMKTGLLIGTPIFALVIILFAGMFPGLFSERIQQYIHEFDQYLPVMKAALTLAYLIVVLGLWKFLINRFKKPTEKLVYSDSLRKKIGMASGLGASAIGFIIILLVYQTGIPTNILEISIDVINAMSEKI